MILLGPASDDARIIVKSLCEARQEWPHFGAVITIEDPDEPEPLRLRGGDVRQLILKFHDIDFEHPRWRSPEQKHVVKALQFARSASGKRLLVHCHAGLSRSPAIALAVIADRMGKGREEEAMAELASLVPSCVPNMAIVRLADAVLCRGGALTDAVRKHEEKSGPAKRVRLLKVLAAGA